MKKRTYWFVWFGFGLSFGEGNIVVESPTEFFLVKECTRFIESMLKDANVQFVPGTVIIRNYILSSKEAWEEFNND